MVKFLVVFLALIVFISGCASQTPDTNLEPLIGEEEIVEPEQELTPSVSVNDQEVSNGSVIVNNVVSAQLGWIVIHADSGDNTPGPVIGQSQVNEGTNNNVSVNIDEDKATPKLFAMLHLDTGSQGLYEFPDADKPVKVDDKLVVKGFNATNIEEPLQPEPEPTLPPDPEPEPEPEPVPQLKEFYIEADDNDFYDEDGDVITELDLVKGDEVTITFFVRKTGVYFAGLKFKGPDFDSGSLAKEEEYVVSFTADEDFKIKSFWPARDVLKATLNINVN